MIHLVLGGLLIGTIFGYLNNSDRIFAVGLGSLVNGVVYYYLEWHLAIALFLGVVVTITVRSAQEVRRAIDSHELDQKSG